jgi:hypothetical protein
LSKFDDEAPPANVVRLDNKKQTSQESFPATWVSDAVLKLDERPIIKGLIDPGAFVVIYGPPSSGKSFFAADIAQHIATGAPWRGRKVTKGLVAYVASEAGGSILKRFVAWRDNRTSELIERIPLVVLTRGPNLLGGTDYAKLEDQLSELQQQTQLPLQMTVFDTLSRSMPGGDENNTENMTQVIRSADDLRSKFNSVTEFVHHAGKDVSKGARGSNTLVAAADVVLQVVECCATVEKVRDGVAGERFPFVLEPVTIGSDADGDPVITCLLNESQAAVMTSAKLPTGRNQKLVLPILRNIGTERSERSPGTSIIPKGVLLLSMTTAIEQIVPKFGTDDPKFRVREKIRDAIVGLQANGFIGVHGDIIWLL